MVASRYVYFGLVLLLASCSSADKSDFSFKNAKEKTTMAEVWSTEFDERIADMAVSESGAHVVVSTIDDEKSNEPSQSSIHLFNDEGKKLWSKDVKVPVHSLAVSSSGSLVLLSSRTNRVSAYGLDGKLAWKRETFCRPRLLSRARKIICFHDDDPRPGVAFEAFDWNGNLVQTVKSKLDALKLKPSADELHVLAGFDKGYLQLFDSQLTSRYRVRVKGELVDFALSSGPQPMAAAIVLFRDSLDRGGQKLVVYNSEGKPVFQSVLRSHAQQVGISDDSKKISVYGNSPAGQHLALYSWENKKSLDQKWSYKEAHFADYTSQLRLKDPFVMVGFENKKQSHIFAFDLKGQVQYDLPLKTEEGGYIFEPNLRTDKKRVFVATDESVFSAYELVKD